MVERVLARLGKPGANRYFFDKLENPAWVAPLYARGFFKRPPAPDHDSAKGTISYPDWPELRYLHRMAALIPEVVGDIAVSIPETANSRIRELQVQIGQHLNRAQSRKLAARAIDWLDDAMTLRHFGEPFCRFIVHLVELNELESAVRLARRLFAAEEHYEGPRRVQLDEWHYDRYLNICLPALRDRAPLLTLAMLRDLLLDATREPQAGQQDDFSYIYRRDLLNSNHRVKQHSDILIDALRDLALDLSQRHDIGFQAVRDALLVRPRAILTRIVLFIASKVCDSEDPFVLATLLDTRLLDRLTYRVEYALLLQANFAKLPNAAQQQVVTAILVDPLQTIPVERQKEMDPEHLLQRTKAIMRNRLAAFGDALPPELTEKSAELVAELGEMQLPAITSGWVGPTSPIPIDDLGAKSVPELISFLGSWAPTQEFSSPSREGIARDLQKLAKERATEWSKESTKFVGLNPTYVRGFILGLNDACDAKMSIAWPEVLRLIQWVMDQPRAIVTNHNALDEGEDPDWSWTRQAGARLITSALTTPEAGLESGARAWIWAIIDELLDDPDPLAEADPREDTEPLTTSINSVRGLAAHALFRFAWWIHNQSLPLEPGLILTFDRMPEIKIGVVRVLDDRAPALHSVLGDWFRTIFYFDSAWTTENIDGLFPESPEQRPYWLATWRAFAEYDQPYDPAFPVLLRKYAFAVEQLRDATEEERKKIGETGSGLHLSSYYWRGVGGEETRQLLRRFFDLCTSTAAAHVLWSLGGGLESAEPIPPQTIDALARLWSDLREQSANWTELKRREVYRQFGRWFKSGRFDTQWALRELKHAIELGSGIIDVEGILERLATECAAYPAEVADILEPLLRDDRQLWQPMLWQAQVEAVLRALLGSTNEVARAHAARIADLLVQDGSLFARSLLAHKGSPA